VTAVDEALGHAEELLGKLSERRLELERLAESEDLDADSAVDVIADLAALAKEIEAELVRARSLADAAS
jgi:hypothetical protein